MYNAVFFIAAGPIECTNTTLPVTNATSAVTDVPTSAVTNATSAVTDVSTSAVTDDVSTNYVTIVPAGRVSIALISVIFFITLLCILAHGYKGENYGPCRAIVYCCNCIAILVLLGLVIACSVLAFLPEQYSNPDCVYLDAPIATVALSYIFIILTCCSWVFCLCVHLLPITSRAGSNQYERV